MTRTNSAKNRGTAIGIATIIFYISGVVEIIVGLSLVSLGNIVSSIYLL